MKTSFTVFYSWQSDKIKNKNFISNAIEKAIRVIRNEEAKTINLEINLDRDTRNTAGSPLIAQTIFDKISQSDIFICDVSIINNNLINRTFKFRLTPNPNVLTELGYAISHLGWERIICVNNLEYGETDLLPFDIKGHRISTFRGHNALSKRELSSTMKMAIKSIISDYENIILRHKKDNLKQHDTGIFLKMENILSETVLNDNLNTITTNLYYNNLHNEGWKEIITFYDDSINHFINKTVHKNVLELIALIEKFRSLCYAEINVENNCGQTLWELRDSGIEITEELKYQALQNERYFVHKTQYNDKESWGEVHRRIDNLQETLNNLRLEIKEKYRVLIENYKREILN